MKNNNELKEVKELLNKIKFNDYDDFNSGFWNEEEVLASFKAMVKEKVSEILFLEVKEASLSKKELSKLPKEILRFKDFSEWRGINYYILKRQEDILSVFVGVFGGSTGRANDSYMQEVLKDPEINKKTRKISVSYRDFLESQK